MTWNTKCISIVEVRGVSTHTHSQPLYKYVDMTSPKNTLAIFGCKFRFIIKMTFPPLNFQFFFYFQIKRKVKRHNIMVWLSQTTHIKKELTPISTNVFLPIHNDDDEMLRRYIKPV